jgi:two-component system sensor histidine kinase KdpD
MSVLVGSVDDPWGVIGVQTDERRVFTEDDVHFLTAVANVLAGAVDRRRKLDHEREAQEVGKAFIGVVNHELRTPITTIYAGAKLLSRLPPSDPEHAVLIADVEAEADRLYRLTEDLLVLTRVERDDLQIAREPVLVNHLLERVLASERRRWPLMRFAVDIRPGLAAAVGEDSYVEQVLRNLISNAAKYSPSGSTIRISVDDTDTDVTVRVLDEGPGIGLGEEGELFTLFYRSPATAQQASGAGIGLFVCQRLVAAMGGRLWARNRSDGGSEFGFALAHYHAEDDDPDTDGHAASTAPGNVLPSADALTTG